MFGVVLIPLVTHLKTSSRTGNRGVAELVKLSELKE